MQLFMVQEKWLDRRLLESLCREGRCKARVAKRPCTGRQDHHAMELQGLWFAYPLDTADGAAGPDGHQHADVPSR